MIRASKLELFKYCDHWLGAEPEESSEAAKAGTAKHKIIADYLRDGVVPIELTERAALTDIDRFVRENGAMSHTEIETRLSYVRDGRRIVIGEDIPFDAVITGQPDLIMVSRGEVKIVDWKTGHHAVMAHGNPQLICYAYMAAIAFREICGDSPLVSLFIGQFQEWSDRVEFRRADYNFATVREHFEFFAWLAELAPMTRGFAGEHCDRLYCPKRKLCDLR